MNDRLKNFDQRSLLVVILSIIFIVAIILSFTQKKQSGEEISLAMDTPPPAPSILRPIPQDATEDLVEPETKKKLIINSASVSEIAKSLKGIGPKTAQLIVDYREAHGPFQNLQQLQKVKGVGLTKTEDNREIISFESPQ
jgi:competence protein ComEA